MTIEDFTLINVLQGFFSLIFVIISVIVGLKIISKYFEYRKHELLLVGIAWIGMANPWMPDSINFILLIMNKPFLSDIAYFIIGNAFLPIFILLWLYAFTELLHMEKRRLVLIIALILSVIFEIVFFTFIALNRLDLIGKRLGPFYYEFSDFIYIFLISCISVVLITGLLFARESMKSEKLEIKLKGKLLLCAFLLFTAGALLDASPILTEFTVVLTRVILISSALFFYSGFILPNWIKNLFLKSND
ncbi:MAG: hypothetical protein ACTSQJ_17065 [Promethearchaeota archaeon]